MHLEAIGHDDKIPFLEDEGATQRARAHAQRNLAKKCENVVLPTPCPCCGYYQDDMAGILKEEAYHDRLFGVGMAVTVLSFIPLAFSVPNIWIATVAGVSLGGALMAYVELAAARFDPNAGDPEPRKLFGQKHTLWGEKLEKLRATLASADPSDGRTPSS